MKIEFPKKRKQYGLSVSGFPGRASYFIDGAQVPKFNFKLATTENHNSDIYNVARKDCLAACHGMLEELLGKSNKLKVANIHPVSNCDCYGEQLEEFIEILDTYKAMVEEL